MTQKTPGIVLRSVKYGETSLIVSAFTELFGIQSFIVNGVRSEKKEGSKAALYQPGNILLMEIYFNEKKAVNRIKEASRHKLLSSNATDVVKNAVVLFQMELLQKLLKHPEKNEELFYFVEESLETLDKCTASAISKEPIRFLLMLAQQLGFGIIPAGNENKKSAADFFDLSEGCFLEQQPNHLHFLYGKEAAILAQLLSTGNTAEEKIENPDKLINKLLEYYTLHAHDPGKLRSLPMLLELLS